MNSKNKFFYFLQHERRIIWTGFIIGLILAVAYTAVLYHTMYSTDAKLYIKNLPKGNVITAYGDSGAVHSESGYSNPLFNYREILASETLAAKTYKTLSLRFPNDLTKMGIDDELEWADKFPKLLGTKVIPSTDIIKLDFKWGERKNTRAALSQVINDFKALNLDIRNETEVGNTKYIDEQQIRIDHELDAIRRKIQEYRTKYQATDIADESQQLTVARVDLQKQAQLLRSQMVFNKSKLGNLSQQLGIKSAGTALRATSIGSDPYLIELNQNLATAQQNYSRMKATYKDEYPGVKQAKSQVDSLAAAIDARKVESGGKAVIGRGLYDPSSSAIATDMARMQAESVSTSAQLKTLEEGISTMQAKENALPQKQQGLDVLLKQETALMNAYQQVSAKQMEAHLKQDMVMDNIVVLSSPGSVSWAFLDYFVKIFALLVLSTLGSLAIAWIRYDMEDKWADASEIEAVTGHKVLGVMPWLKKDEANADTGYFQSSKSLLGIAYGNIVNGLVARSYLDNVRTISFMSTTFSRKDSPIIHNVAATLSRLGKSVIIVDTDFENPAKLLTAMGLNVTANRDLSALIIETQQKLRMSTPLDQGELMRAVDECKVSIRHNPGGSNSAVTFQYLAPKANGNNIHELLSLPAFHAIVEILKHEYDFILLDSPSKPIIYPEVQTVVNISDAVVLISSMKSSRQDLAAAISFLEKVNAKILGIIPRDRSNVFEKQVFLERQSRGASTDDLLAQAIPDVRKS